MTATSFVSTPVLSIAGAVNTGAVGKLMSLTVEETIVGMYWYSMSATSGALPARTAVSTLG